ncbi:MAG: histidine kinase, partial [Pseudomonadota bacterium]
QPETQPETQPEPEPEPENAVQAPDQPAQQQAESGQPLAVQTARVGPWIVAVPVASAPRVLAPDTPCWTQPGGPLLLLHDDEALPALDLALCWTQGEAIAPERRAALLLQPPSGEPPFAVRVDAIGPSGELIFWPVPQAVKTACGVQATAWQGAPWAPDAGEPVLLIDLPWLSQKLLAGAEA